MSRLTDEDVDRLIEAHFGADEVSDDEYDSAAVFARAVEAAVIERMRQEPPTECADDDSPWLVCKPCAAAGRCARAAVTDEMVTAYLTANDAYWKRIDGEPTKIGKWRNGTPSEATRVSLAAALNAATVKDCSQVAPQPAEAQDAARYRWLRQRPTR